jgi:hypothetical protein
MTVFAGGGALRNDGFREWRELAEWRYEYRFNNLILNFKIYRGWHMGNAGVGAAAAGEDALKRTMCVSLRRMVHISPVLLWVNRTGICIFTLEWKRQSDVVIFGSRSSTLWYLPYSSLVYISLHKHLPNLKRRYTFGLVLGWIRCAMLLRAWTSGTKF